MVQIDYDENRPEYSCVEHEGKFVLCLTLHHEKRAIVLPETFQTKKFGDTRANEMTHMANFAKTQMEMIF